MGKMDWRNIDWKLTGRTERERYIAYGGGAIAVVLLVWVVIWHPLLNWQSQAKQRYESKRSTLEWMQGAAAQIEAYRRSGRSNVKSYGSPDQAITKGAVSLGLTLSRMEPSGDKRFNVYFSTADYRNLLRFLNLLQQQGIAVESLTMGQLPEPGQVSVRMTLESAR